MQAEISNGAVLQELAKRTKDIRIARSLTQSALASRAGVSTRTVTALEAGQSIRLDSFISILRALGMLSHIDYLLPEQGVRPSDLAKFGKKRQRVRKPRQARMQDEPVAWKWGDE